MSFSHMQIQGLDAIIHNNGELHIILFVNFRERDVGVTNRAFHGD